MRMRFNRVASATVLACWLVCLSTAPAATEPTSTPPTAVAPIGGGDPPPRGATPPPPNCPRHPPPPHHPPHAPAPNGGGPRRRGLPASRGRTRRNQCLPRQARGTNRPRRGIERIPRLAAAGSSSPGLPRPRQATLQVDSPEAGNCKPQHGAA